MLHVRRTLGVRSRCGVLQPRTREFDLAARILVSESGVDSHEVRSSRISEPDRFAVMETTNLLEELPIYIDESSGLTLSILPRKSKYRKDCQKQDSKDLERRSGRCQTARPSRPQLCVGLAADDAGPSTSEGDQYRLKGCALTTRPVVARSALPAGTHWPYFAIADRSAPRLKTPEVPKRGVATENSIRPDSR